MVLQLWRVVKGIWEERHANVHGITLDEWLKKDGVDFCCKLIIFNDTLRTDIHRSMYANNSKGK